MKKLLIDTKPSNSQLEDTLPRNSIVFDSKPTSFLFEDTKPSNSTILDTKPKMSDLTGKLTQSYSVVHTAGVIMLTVPLITYSSAGTETQWGESGGIF